MSMPDTNNTRDETRSGVNNALVKTKDNPIPEMELITLTQSDVQSWERILHTSGGALRIQPSHINHLQYSSATWMPTPILGMNSFTLLSWLVPCNHTDQQTRTTTANQH
jgi:hypothetical protein